MTAKIYRFGDFVLDQKRREFFAAGNSIALSSKAFELLAVLVANSGNIVEKEIIFKLVWKDSFVEEGNLPVHISALRRIFKKNGGADFIKTVSGRGYIFTAQVAEISENPAEVSANPAAENLYVKGKYILETVSTRLKIKEDLHQAIEFFNAAIKTDSNFTKAYIGIGHAYIKLNDFGYLPRNEAHLKCQTLLRQIHSTTLPNAEISFFEGIVNLFFELDIENAQKSFRKAIELEKNHAPANHYLAMTELFLGKMESATFHYEKACQIDPNNIAHRNGLIRVHYYSCDFNRAIIEAKEVLEMDNRSFPAVYLLASGYAELGITNEALDYINRTLEIFDNLEIRAKKAYILAMMNEPPEAEKIIAECLADEQKMSANLLAIAAIYTVQNKFDAAFQLLFEYLHKTDYPILTIKVDPRFRRLRNDPRFQILLEKLRLV